MHNSCRTAVGLSRPSTSCCASREGRPPTATSARSASAGRPTPGYHRGQYNRRMSPRIFPDDLSIVSVGDGHPAEPVFCARQPVMTTRDRKYYSEKLFHIEALLSLT
jgi:hypothetical protein